MLRQKTYSFLTLASLLLIFILSVYAGADELHCGAGQSYSSIQAAIDDADDGDIVIAEPGTYLENIDFLGKAITVRSTDPCDPCVVAATIIDGGEPDDPNNASVVTFKSGEGNNSILTGFTIVNGTGSWLIISWEFKGPLWNRCGGGVVCYNMSEPTISGNVFRDNIAGQGSGIYIYGDPVNISDPSNPPIHLAPIIQNNIFEDNNAVVDHGFVPPDTNYPHSDHGDGGAIVGFQGVDAIIVDNEIRNNHADSYGGGLHLRQWSDGLIEDNHILDNDSALGAGVHITYSSSPHITENLIESNVAGGLGGGGIYVYYLSEPLIERNIIRQNESTNGAGIGVYYSSNPTIANNMIYRNTSGAAIRMVSSTPVIRGNTITKNDCGGVTCYSSAPVIQNNILTSNGTGWGIDARSGSVPTVCYNNVWNNSAGNYGYEISDQTGMNGNISVRPGFIDEAGSDYHLDYDSDCINAGDPNYVPQDGETDYYGDNRLMGQYVDIGADEARTVWNITSREQYETIQQAIDEAIDADVIVVTLGVHSGDGNRDIDFDGREITVRSIDPNDSDVVEATVIDCEDSQSNPHRGFYFHNAEDANSIVEGLTITNGAGKYEGGGIFCVNSNPTIRNCIIFNNSSAGRGGGIYCRNNSCPTINNCIISENTATRGYGGGICCWYDSMPIVTNCIINNNSAQGYHHGGGICCMDGSDAIVSGCVVSGNYAGHRGGGLYAYWCSPIFTNCTVIGNIAEEGGGLGSFREANPTLRNCILRDNRATLCGAELALINTNRVWPSDIPTWMTVSYSNVEGGEAGACVDENCTLYWETGNIDSDPCFAIAGYWHENNTPQEPNDDYYIVGNYHLRPASSCIDSGDNSLLPEWFGFDYDGDERIIDGNKNEQAIVDMGADELIPNPFADINNDGMVDLLDLAYVVDDWLVEDENLPGDLYEDDTIDLKDFGELAQWWLWRGQWITP